MPKPTKDPGPLAFTATIEQDDSSGAAGFIVFPYDLKETYGIGNLVPVVATFDGIEYRGSIAKMGPEPLLLIRKDVREKLGKAAGDPVEVTVTVDKSAREVDVPDDLTQALNANPGAKSNFENLAYSHQRNYVLWINEAKRAQTRDTRVHKAVEMLSAGKRLK
jgi:bifunctional DNA-binding transcriptional regulator/antitoxin component of YhaV-PrlF toxin-antitoxin module